jgi:hypothetical protein
MTDAQIGARLRQILNDPKTHPAQRNLVLSCIALRWPELHTLLTDQSIIGERKYVGDPGFSEDRPKTVISDEPYTLEPDEVDRNGNRYDWSDI